MFCCPLVMPLNFSTLNILRGEGFPSPAFNKLNHDSVLVLGARIRWKSVGMSESWGKPDSELSGQPPPAALAWPSELEVRAKMRQLLSPNGAEAPKGLFLSTDSNHLTELLLQQNFWRHWKLPFPVRNGRAHQTLAGGNGELPLTGSVVALPAVRCVGKVKWAAFWMLLKRMPFLQVTSSTCWCHTTSKSQPKSELQVSSF